MTKFKGSLELNWINKDKSLLYEIDEDEGMGIKPIWVEKDDIRVSEPRLLNLEGEYGNPNNENMLIRGDNLLALRTLVEKFKNREEKDKIKCIYIDPPFNIGTAFEHYDDNLEQSEWLTMMRDRIILLKKLLRSDGIICVHIDDAEAHYLRLLLDEIFGRHNFFSVIYIQSVYPSKTLKQDRIFHDLIEQILIYRNSIESSVSVNLDYEKYSYEKFCWYITEKEEPWKTIKLGGKKVDIFQKGTYSINESVFSMDGLKEIWASGTILDINSSGRFFRDYFMGRYGEDGYNILYKVWDIGDDNHSFRYFTGPKKKGATKGKYYQGVPKKVLDNPETTLKKKSIENYWNMAADFGNCRHEGGVELKSGKKPEILLYKIIKYFTNEGDYVLDSFLGSGTTSAVSHKMKRRWIGIELGKQAETHCLKRLNCVVNDEDQTGISKELNWQGGGGFRYYEVGESIIKNLDMNWDMTIEEMSRAVFMNFDYSMIEGDTHQLETEGDEFYLGKQKGGIAICLVTKGTKIIRRTELNKLVKDLSKKYPAQKVTIFTNMGVAVKPEELSDKLDVKKIPESILKKYRMV